jgi:hypothetical protein
MLKLDLERLSMSRKILVSASGVLYALAVLGNARHGNLISLLSVTIFFVVITTVLFIWVK